MDQYRLNFLMTKKIKTNLSSAILISKRCTQNKFIVLKRNKFNIITTKNNLNNKYFNLSLTNINFFF